jgi:pyruvate/2-oxoacid:ferredoxin oxidoreductase beta subunit
MFPPTTGLVCKEALLSVFLGVGRPLRTTAAHPPELLVSTTGSGASTATGTLEAVDVESDRVLCIGAEGASISIGFECSDGASTGMSCSICNNDGYSLSTWSQSCSSLTDMLVKS